MAHSGHDTVYTMLARIQFGYTGSWLIIHAMYGKRVGGLLVCEQTHNAHARKMGRESLHSTVAQKCTRFSPQPNPDSDSLT